MGLLDKLRGKSPTPQAAPASSSPRTIDDAKALEIAMRMYVVDDEPQLQEILQKQGKAAAESWRERRFRALVDGLAPADLQRVSAYVTEIRNNDPDRK